MRDVRWIVSVAFWVCFAAWYFDACSECEDRGGVFVLFECVAPR